MEKKRPTFDTSINEKTLRFNVQDSGFFSKQCELNLGNETLKVLPKGYSTSSGKRKYLTYRFFKSWRKSHQ